MGLNRTKIEMEKTKSFGAGLPCTKNPGPGYLQIGSLGGQYAQWTMA